MLDLVPLAGAGRQVTHGDGNGELVGQLLELGGGGRGEVLPIVDVVELRVAIGIVRSLACLTVGLQTVIELVQEFADQGAADYVAGLAELRRP